MAKTPKHVNGDKHQRNHGKDISGNPLRTVQNHVQGAIHSMGGKINPGMIAASLDGAVKARALNEENAFRHIADLGPHFSISAETLSLIRSELLYRRVFPQAKRGKRIEHQVFVAQLTWHLGRGHIKLAELKKSMPAILADHKVPKSDIATIMKGINGIRAK